ncbi:MAG: glycosyltransferase family 4 protein [Chitinophagaceae bacterium]|nr:glycosyltransferase family 4 protein [Chitinophagaceae bacterium]
MELNNRKLKRILIFVDWYEPGFKGGGPIRSVANIVYNLHDRYEFFIFTSNRDLGETMPYKNITADVWTSANNACIFYASPKSLSWSAISSQIKSVAPDFIYLNGMYAKYYAIYPLLIKRLNITAAKVILAPRGMLQSGALQFKPAKKKLFLKLFSLLSIPRRIVGHATDEQEKNDIYKHLPGIRDVVILSNFSSIPKAEPLPVNKEKNILHAAFISRVSPKKNLLFLLLLLKEIKSSVNFHLTVIGNVEDEEYWEQCKNAISQLPPNIVVNYKGPINNNEVHDILNQHHIFVLPTLGENFGHAIFEALSAGRPVLISDQTPWRNLPDVKAGWDLPLSTASAFVDALNDIGEMDDGTFQVWSKGAWQLANDYINKSDLKDQYLKLFS